jgi:Domain of unknown function (DUF1906)
MPLACVVQNAPPGISGFDWSDGALSFDDARRYCAQGYGFCIRYVSRSTELQQYNQARGTPDLSLPEAQDILAAGLALMVVQHPELPGWVPTAALGNEYGSCAARLASEAGIIAGVNVFLDLEGIAAGTDPQDIVDYSNNWFDQVAAAGYAPGIYIGYDVWLSPDELYGKLKFKHYWRAGGDITDVANRGYQMLQTIDGDFDSDVTQNDNLGGCVVWQTNNPIAA